MAEWSIRIRSKTQQEIYVMSDEKTGTGLLDCPSLLDRATVYIQGATDARFAGCVGVVPVLMENKK